MNYTIENNLIKITVKKMGAELTSIRTLDPDLEYLWQPQKNSVWGAQSPILFPIIGVLANNTYFYNDKSYHLLGHGFAKDQEFLLETKKTDAICLSIHDNEETLKNYPFKFYLKVAYLIKDNSITIQYNVKNTDTKTMYFSIGGHPGFRCPLLDNESYTDYKLYLPQTEKIDRIVNHNQFLTGETELFLNDENLIDFSRLKLPQGQRVIILKGLKSEQITLMNCKTEKGVTVQFTGFPYLGLWPIEDNPLICIEPWFGITSMQNIVLDLKDKPGMQSLNPGKDFNASFSISVF